MLQSKVRPSLGVGRSRLYNIVCPFRRIQRKSRCRDQDYQALTYVQHQCIKKPRFLRAMLQLHNTPDTSECNISPAQMIFGRPVRDTPLSFVDRLSFCSGDKYGLGKKTHCVSRWLYKLFTRLLLHSRLLYFERKTVYTYRPILCSLRNNARGNQDKK